MTCFGRTAETTELWRYFKAANLLMLAPRRIGKTVQINHLRDTAAEHDFRAIVLEVAGFREEKDFFRQCCAAIQEELSTGAKVMTAFGERLSRILRG
ncbi:MAG: hypothetical protein MZV65_47420 [Chromatiales bacterium]|nr:hypothetical protein [Chromatiales bacterium]